MNNDPIPNEETFYTTPSTHDDFVAVWLKPIVTQADGWCPRSVSKEYLLRIVKEACGEEPKTPYVPPQALLEVIRLAKAGKEFSDNPTSSAVQYQVRAAVLAASPEALQLIEEFG